MVEGPEGRPYDVKLAVERSGHESVKETAQGSKWHDGSGGANGRKILSFSINTGLYDERAHEDTGGCDRSNPIAKPYGPRDM